LFAFLFFKPWIVGFYAGYFKNLNEGPKLFLMHTFIFSTPTAFFCLAWVLLLQYLKLIPIIRFKFSKKTVLSGFVWGIVITAVTLAIAPLLRMPYGFHFNPWSIAGNLTSNFCEEIIFRGLLFFALWISTGSKPLSILLSGIIFGLTHEQYPWLIKGYISMIGCLLSYMTAQGNNLIPAVIAHDISDWILDLFL
jgi:membrane protease YdiL (CAAX protease family)